MKKIKLLLTILPVFTFTFCADKYDKEFYGTYSLNDSFHIRFSKLTFYPDNIYSFYGHSCLAGNRDSGEYKLVKDTIMFKSFNLHLVDTNSYPVKPLTGKKFLYRKDSVYYFHYTTFPNKTVQIDTTCWTKE